MFCRIRNRQRILILEERETLLPSKLPGSAASFSGIARLVECYNFWSVCGGGGGRGTEERRRFRGEFFVRRAAL